MVDNFEAALHPRGADGRFIEKFGLIKFLKDSKWQYGKVTDISKDDHGNISVKVDESDLSGNATGASHVLSPKQVYQAPKPTGYLKIASPDAKKVGGQAGSNPGGLYELPEAAAGTGDYSPAPTNKWYVKKAKTPKHGHNEDLANDLYRSLGVPVPDVIYDEGDGNIYSKIVDGAVEDMTSHLSAKDEPWIDQMRTNFAIDAWLANWDVFGMTWDNVKTAPDGVPYRIDNGGALLYRAQGSPKGKDFGAEVGELTSFKNGKRAQVFGGMTKEQEIDGAQRILALRPEQIKEMVAKHKMPPSLADTLIARRKFIADHYGLDLPEEMEKIPVDTVDLTTSGGKERWWKKSPLASLLAILSTGDMVEIEGEQHIYGVGVPGIPVGVASKNIQMSQWLHQHGAATEVWFSKGGVSSKPRPEHGYQMLLGELGDYSWERGDKINIEGHGPMEVVEINNNTGIALLLPEGETTPVVWSLRYDGQKSVQVDLWDKKKSPVVEPGIEAEEEPPIEEWEMQLLAFPVPEAPKPQAVAVTAEIKAEIKQDAQVKAVSTGKSMALGDGTEADVGAKVFSSKDGKTYIYVKKKGPYAVVTDPDSDEPNKPLQKMASTLSQPDKEPTAIPEAGSKTVPTTANGVVPLVGMTASAKDGHSGTITMVSPDGKFVFITDSTGKKKRKSTGTVSIDSKDSVDAAPEPVVSTNDQGQTVISVPPVEDVEDVPTIKALYPEAASWWPTPSKWDADGDRYWAAKIEPDGSYGMVPVATANLNGDHTGYITTEDGKLAGFDVEHAALLVDTDVAINAAMNVPPHSVYRVLVQGQWWDVLPETGYGANGNDVVLSRTDNAGDHLFMVVTSDSGKLPMQRFTADTTPPFSPDVIDNIITVNPPSSYADFTPLNELGLAKGDKVSLDGHTWLTVDKAYTLAIRLKNDDGNYVYLGNNSGTTVLYKEHTPIPEPVVVTPDAPWYDKEMSAAQQTVNQLLEKIETEDVGNYNTAAVVQSQHLIKDHYVTIQDMDGKSHSGAVVKIADYGGSWVELHTPEGTKKLTLPKEWPVLLHGSVEPGNAPVPLTLKQWAGMGIGGAVPQYVQPSGAGTGTEPVKVLGIGPDGYVQFQNTNGTVFPGWSLDHMQTSASSDQYLIGFGDPPGVTFPPVEKGPDLSKNSHDDSVMKIAHTSWDSLPDTVNKPTNTTVYYAANQFIWQNGDGSFTTVWPASGKVQSDFLPTNQWPDFLGELTPFSSPEPVIVKLPTSSTMEFEAVPDHYMVEAYGLMWAVPKGGMAAPETWIATPSKGQGEPGPGLLKPNADVSAAVIILDPDTPNPAEPPEVSQAEPKVPDGWPPHADKAAKAYPGQRLIKTGGAVYVEVSPDQWAYYSKYNYQLDADTTYATSDFGTEGDSFEIWNPAGAVEKTITLHGHQFGEDAHVIHKEWSSEYFVKETPASDWKVIHGSGIVFPVSDEDLDPWSGEPYGNTIWPAGFTPEKPVEDPHVLGGESTTMPGIPTEKDGNVAKMTPTGDGVVWLKAHEGNGTTIKYYAMEDDQVTVWYVHPGEEPNQAGVVPLADFKTPAQKMAYFKNVLPPNSILTDVTPNGFVDPTPEKPAKLWDDLVVETVNPSKHGYSGLSWTDPATLTEVPEGWDQADWEGALEYAATIGPKQKAIMVSGKNSEGKNVAELFLITATGHAMPFGSGPMNVAPNYYQDMKHDPTDPLGTLINALPMGQDYDWTISDVSPVAPVNHIIGYDFGVAKTPGNQWAVPISPEWTVFDAVDKSTGNPIAHLYRDGGGAWWWVDKDTGVTVSYAPDDDSAVKKLKSFDTNLVEHVMSTDSKAPDTDPANVPGPVNKAHTAMTYTAPSGAKYLLAPGSKLWSAPGNNSTQTFYFIESPTGAWQYSTDFNTGDPTPEIYDWPQGSPLPGSGTVPLTPVDIGGTSAPQAAPPTTPAAHPTTMSAPPVSGISDPSAILAKDKVVLANIDHHSIPVGTWMASTYDGTDEVYWMKMTGETSFSGNPKMELWHQDESGTWNVVEGGSILYSTSPDVWMADGPPTGIPVSTSTPSVPKPQVTAPSGATYPGSELPSADAVTAWGGDLTKDGYIPTAGMKVKGKGPMKGTVVSISKDRTKAVVMKEDGTKTTRLIVALNVDHAGNMKTYGTVTHLDIPSDMPFAADPPDVAIKKVLTKDPGQMSGFVLANDGIRDSKVTLVHGKDKDGNPVVRAYFQMTSEAAAGVPSALAVKEGSIPLGAWESPTKQSQNVAIGDQIAMHTISSGKWRVNSNGTEPSHKVTKIEPGPEGGGQMAISMENLKTGEVIVSHFQPNKPLTTHTWDANKPVPVQPGSVVLSAQAKAQGWEKVKGAKISTMSNGVWQPNHSAVDSQYGTSQWGTHETFRQTAADGTVIEVLSASSKGMSTDGFSAITVPAGPGTDPDKAIMSALDRIGVGYKPPTQTDFKREVIRRLSTSLSYSKTDMDSLNGADVSNPNDAEVKVLFAKFGTTIGVPDVGWHDVSVGQDHRGDTTFYWSDRVVEAMEKKAKGNVILRAASSGSVSSAVSSVMNGSMPGVMRVAQGFSGGVSAAHDNSNFAGGGSYFSQQHAGNLPSSNSLATYKGAGMMVYYRPTALFRQIKDYRAADNDAYGNPGHGTNSIQKALNQGSVRDFYVHGGLNADDIGYLALKTETNRQETIKQLKAKGITTIGGRPIEEVVITIAQAKSKKANDLPLPLPPPNVVPIESVPMSYEAAVPGGGPGGGGVVAAVDTEVAA